MRLNFVVLLAICLLVATESTSVATSSELVTHNLRSLRGFETSHADNEERAGIQKISNFVKTRASKLVDSATLQTYVLRKKTGVQVLNKLQLGDDVAAALANKKMDTLAKYITMYNKNAKNKISLIGTLTTRYGDDAVARALVDVQKNGGTDKIKETAKSLRVEQLSAWLKGDKSVDDVFNLLKLHNNGHEALISRKLEVLEDYITFFNKAKSGEETLLKTLTTGFDGEKNLLLIVAAGKWDPRTVEKAWGLQNNLLVKWQSDKVQPAIVLKKLKPDLDSYNLQILMKYMTEFNTKNPATKVSYLGTLTSHYGDDIVAVSLVHAKGIPGTRSIAKKLQTQQLKSWLDNGKSLDDTFNLLKINNDGRFITTTGKMETLDEYMKLFNSKNTLDKTNMIQVLSKGFGGEDKFALAISRAMEGPVAQDTRSFASKFQNELFQRWKDNDLDPMSVLVQVFKVDESKLTAVGAQEKSLIGEYRKFYNGKTDVLDQVPYIERPRRS